MFLAAFAISVHGIGISEDTISYLSAARSLHDNGKMLDIDGTPFVAWGPLYPLIISALELLPFGIEKSLAAFSLIVFLLTLITSWRLIQQSLEHPFFRAACFMSLAVSFTLLQVYTVALSEALFLLLINIILQVAINKKGWGRADVLLLGVIAGLALMQRYAGIFLIPFLLIMLAEGQPGGWKPNSGKWRLLLFLLPALVPVVAWLARNWLVAETLTGFRPPGAGLFEKNITVLANTLTSWVLPVKIPLTVRLLLFAALVLLVITKAKIAESRVHRAYVLITAIYVVMLVIAYFFFSFEEPRDRLLAPVLIPFFILLFSALERFSKKFSRSRIIPALICLWMIYPAARAIKHSWLWHHEGAEIYSKPLRKESHLIAWLKGNELSGKIFSNDAYAIYHFAGKNAFRVPKRIYDFHEFYRSAADGSYLVWWEGCDLYQLDTIREKYLLEEAAQLPDGKVFIIRSL